MDPVTTRLEALERALDEVRAENRQMRTWKRFTGLFMGLTAVMFGLLLTPLAPATAQTTQATLEERVAALEFKLLYVSRVGREMIFNAVNVNIRNGGTQTRSTNGLGNLIVGFNERRPLSGDGSDSNVRTGSHNLIIGDWHRYSSYGGLVTGYQNTISGEYASVVGGMGNTAVGYAASVSGGISNTASHSYTSVSGGNDNTTSGFASSVSGGRNNSATGTYTSVSGGFNNTATGEYAAVSGGSNGTAGGSYASISGGASNRAGGLASTVSGGAAKNVAGSYDWRAGELFQNQ